MTENSAAFVVAVAIKWGGSWWVCLMLGNLVYRYLKGTLSLDFLGYAIFMLFLCLAIGAMQGAFKVGTDGLKDQRR